MSDEEETLRKRSLQKVGPETSTRIIKTDKRFWAPCGCAEKKERMRQAEDRG